MKGVSGFPKNRLRELVEAGVLPVARAAQQRDQELAEYRRRRCPRHGLSGRDHKPCRCDGRPWSRPLKDGETDRIVTAVREVFAKRRARERGLCPAN